MVPSFVETVCFLAQKRSVYEKRARIIFKDAPPGVPEKREGRVDRFIGTRPGANDPGFGTTTP